MRAIVSASLVATALLCATAAHAQNFFEALANRLHEDTLRRAGAIPATPSPGPNVVAGPPDQASGTSQVDISNAFYADQIAATQKFSSEVRAYIHFYQPIFQNGKFLVGWTELPDQYVQARDGRMAQMNQGQNYTLNFLAQAESNNYNSRYSIICQFDPSAGALMRGMRQQQVYPAYLKIVSVNGTQLTFDCHF